MAEVLATAVEAVLEALGQAVRLLLPQARLIQSQLGQAAQEKLQAQMQLAT